MPLDVLYSKEYIVKIKCDRNEHYIVTHAIYIYTSEKLNKDVIKIIIAPLDVHNRKE